MTKSQSLTKPSVGQLVEFAIIMGGFIGMNVAIAQNQQRIAFGFAMFTIAAGLFMSASRLKPTRKQNE